MRYQNYVLFAKIKCTISLGLLLRYQPGSTVGSFHNRLVEIKIIHYKWCWILSLWSIVLSTLVIFVSLLLITTISLQLTRTSEAETLQQLHRYVFDATFCLQSALYLIVEECQIVVVSAKKTFGGIGRKFKSPLPSGEIRWFVRKAGRGGGRSKGGTVRGAVGTSAEHVRRSHAARYRIGGCCSRPTIKRSADENRSFAAKEISLGSAKIANKSAFNLHK